MTPTPFLDDQEKINQLDQSHALSSIEQLGEQIAQIWPLAQKIQIDAEVKPIRQVVVAGMGGSALGTHVIQTVFKDELKVPVLIAPDYQVPNFVDQNTLVIASSYSGTTEETLSATLDAQKKGAQIAGITSGGKLAEFLTKHHYPALIFEPKFNPCNQPRMALGYSIFGQIALFNRLGILNLSQNDYSQVLTTIIEAHLRYGIKIKQDRNLAKTLSFELKNRIPIIVAAEHLEGVAHVFANQINENAKNYSEFRTIPELNHHLMEGLKFPENNDENLCFVLVKSELYQDNNQKRFDLTAQLLSSQQIPHQVLNLESTTKLNQAFELLTLGAYTNFYLAMLNHVDPSPIPWVDWFKAELKKLHAQH